MMEHAWARRFFTVSPTLEEKPRFQSGKVLANVKNSIPQMAFLGRVLEAAGIQEQTIRSQASRFIIRYHYRVASMLEN
jgi:hypothetical protein